MVEETNVDTIDGDVGADDVFTPPEGFDADLFDTETRSLSQDKVKERFDSFTAKEESYKKQVNDLRRVISKGIEAPESAEGYSAEYKPEEEFAPYYEDEEKKEFLEANVSAIDKLSYETGMTKEQNKAVKDKFHNLMKDLGVLNAKTEEQKAAEKAANDQWVAQEKAKLGDRADEIIDKNVNYYTNLNILNEAERASLGRAMDSSVEVISALNKLRMMAEGDGYSPSIPTDAVVVGGLADDHSLAREYNNPQTSDTRRMEILKQRLNAGRSGNLPLV